MLGTYINPLVSENLTSNMITSIPIIICTQNTTSGAFPSSVMMSTAIRYATITRPTSTESTKTLGIMITKTTIMICNQAAPFNAMMCMERCNVGLYIWLRCRTTMWNWPYAIGNLTTRWNATRRGTNTSNACICSTKVANINNASKAWRADTTLLTGKAQTGIDSKVKNYS